MTGRIEDRRWLGLGPADATRLPGRVSLLDAVHPHLSKPEARRLLKGSSGWRFLGDLCMLSINITGRLCKILLRPKGWACLLLMDYVSGLRHLNPTMQRVVQTS